MIITPRPKKEKDLSCEITLPERISVFVSDETSQRALRALEVFLDDVRLNWDYVQEEKEAFLCLRHTPREGSRLEEYTLTVEEKGITAEFCDFMGGRNAMASLYQLMRRENGGIRVSGVQLEDWADLGHRELMLDMSYRGMPPERVKRLMVDMALSKMNVLHMHLMDGHTLSLQFDAYPQANNPRWEYYTKEEMRELVAFGKSVGVESMPEIEFSTHNRNLSLAIPSFRCESHTRYTEEVFHATCIGKEEIFDFYDALIGEITEIFDFPIIHIGSDEIVAYDAGVWPMWYDCKHCRKKAEELGIHLSTPQEVEERMNDGTFLDRGMDGVLEMMMYGVKRMHAIVTKHGRRMMMWNDNIDVSKPVDLPKDILIHFWRIAAKYRGPSEGCTMEKFLEQGFELVNSHYPENYFEEELYTPEIPLNQWAPKVYPTSEERRKKQILGGGPCAWGAGNETHFKVNLPSLICFYGDRLWDQSPGDYGESFERKITRLIFGLDTPKDLNVFAALGGYSLPKNSWRRVRKDGAFRYAHLDKITLGKEECEAVRSQLERLSQQNGRYAKQAQDYLFCVNWAIEKKW